MEMDIFICTKRKSTLQVPGEILSETKLPVSDTNSKENHLIKT